MRSRDWLLGFFTGYYYEKDNFGLNKEIAYAKIMIMSREELHKLYLKIKGE